MKKALIAAFAATALVGCSSDVSELGDFPLPSELQKVCKMYRSTDGFSHINIVYCDGMKTATATYSQGKTTGTTVTINGIEYVPAEDQGQ